MSTHKIQFTVQDIYELHTQLEMHLSFHQAYVMKTY